VKKGESERAQEQFGEGVTSKLSTTINPHHGNSSRVPQLYWSRTVLEPHCIIENSQARYWTQWLVLRLYSCQTTRNSCGIFSGVKRGNSRVFLK
jgi:hypothetical protein